MNNESTAGIEQNVVPKIHPASREALPDDPIEIHGMEVPGDRALMLRLLVEEYARMGWGVEELMLLARDPNYTAFYSLRRALGDDELRRCITAVLACCGVMRVTATETTPRSERLVQIDLPV